VHKQSIALPIFKFRAVTNVITAMKLLAQQYEKKLDETKLEVT